MTITVVKKKLGLKQRQLNIGTRQSQLIFVLQKTYLPVSTSDLILTVCLKYGQLLEKKLLWSCRPSPYVGHGTQSRLLGA